MPFMYSHNAQHPTVLVGVLCVPLVLGSIFYINFKDFRNISFTSLIKSKLLIIIALIFFVSVTLSLFSAFYSLVILIFLLILQMIISNKDYNRIKLILFIIGVNLLAIFFDRNISYGALMSTAFFSFLIYPAVAKLFNQIYLLGIKQKNVE